MAYFPAMLKVVILIVMLGWSTCSTNGVSPSNEEDPKYEALIARVNELTARVSALERDRSANFNPAPDISEDRHYYPYYDLALYNPYLNPKINLDKLRKVPSSCADLRYTGEIKNGFYLVKADQSIKIVLCDFWKEEGSAGYETPIGIPDIKSSPVYFLATRNSTASQRGWVRVNYELAITNIGGALNITTGIVTAPRAGIYYFSFEGLALATADNARIFTQLRKNTSQGLIVYGLCNQNKDKFCTVSMHATVQLMAGDTIFVDMKTENTVLYDDAGRYTHFTGWLVEENISSVLATQS